MRADKFIVTEASVGDAAFLAVYGAESFIEAYQETLPISALKAYTRKVFSEESIRREIKQCAADYQVCIGTAGEQYGYSKFIGSEPPSCVASGATVELQRLYIKKECRGEGIGRRLLEAGEHKARQREVRVVWLRVWAGNHSAIEVYRKWDFSVCGEESYRVGDETRMVLVMTKELAY
ncbi:MAG: hypothetical protein DRP64_04385 [Verrucomicrobia bacterium]|nr:MAG: hypothetical protein DRP64_04385 [Verrucomicrobiota bacterium]